MSKRQLILDNVKDLVNGFLYYDRKEDQDLPRGEIEKSISAGEITKEEIIETFTNELNEYLK